MLKRPNSHLSSNQSKLRATLQLGHATDLSNGVGHHHLGSCWADRNMLLLVLVMKVMEVVVRLVVTGQGMFCTSQSCRFEVKNCVLW